LREYELQKTDRKAGFWYNESGFTSVKERSTDYPMGARELGAVP
jgi:hypothetical protein